GKDLAKKKRSQRKRTRLFVSYSSSLSNRTLFWYETGANERVRPVWILRLHTTAATATVATSSSPTTVIHPLDDPFFLSP
ncbi:hypothetical protein PFISCL1PPCAC_23406, partial [Pristionchus fissidentatus]